MALAVLVGLAIAVPSSYAGQILYQTDFEPPTFSPGVLVGQDNWTAPPPLSPKAAVIFTDNPLQGQQSVLVLGKDLKTKGFIKQATNGYYEAIGSYRQPVDFDPESPQTVRVSALVQVDGPLTPGINFFSASIGAVAQGFENGKPTPEGVGELAISSDGQIHAYTGADLVPTFLASASVSLGVPHTLAVEANFATRQTSFFVDGVLLGGKAFPFDDRVTTNILLRGSMLTYCAQDSYFKKKDYSARFDTFKIEVE